MLRSVLQLLLLSLPTAALLLAGRADAVSLLFEVRQLTATAPPFSRNVYACPSCTVADFATVVAPSGFEKAPGKYLLPSQIDFTLPVAPPGVAQTLDLVAAIPGDDFRYIASVVGGQIIGVDPTLGFLATTQVQRSTTFRFDAGAVVHFLTDTAGDRYALFSFDIGLAETYDLDVVGGLAALGGRPAGWTYSSELLSQSLYVPSNGLAQVFAQGQFASWQKIVPVPEPGTALLVGLGVTALGVFHRRVETPGPSSAPRAAAGSRRGRRARSRAARALRAPAPS